MLWRESTGKMKLQNRWYTYLGLAFLDVEGNFLHTSITSVTLLDSATIPAVMILSWFVFRSRYNVGHIVGAMLCCGGLALLVITDGNSSTGGPNPLLGDALVIAGACVYAVCNVCQERLLGLDTSRWELLTMVGGFGSLISGVQAFLLERDQWAHLWNWDESNPNLALAQSLTPGYHDPMPDVSNNSMVPLGLSPPSSPLLEGGTDPVQDHWILVLGMLGFAVSLFLFSILLPSVLILGSSTILNLSLLTSDLWAAAARMTFFGAWAFCVTLLAEVVGLTMFCMSGATHNHRDSLDADHIRRHARREYADELEEARGADVEGLLDPDSSEAAERQMKRQQRSSFGDDKEGGLSSTLLQTDSKPEVGFGGWQSGTAGAAAELELTAHPAARYTLTEVEDNETLK
eukprot:gene5006-34791_t